MIKMDLQKIKVKEIPEEVKQWCEAHASTTGFTYGAYFEYIKGEVVERLFATRRYTKHGVRIREVARYGTGKSFAIARDIIYSQYAGYTPVWEKKAVYRSLQGWRYRVFEEDDFGKWYRQDRCIGVGYVEINPSMVFEIPEFKYCGYSGGGLIQYLNAYRKDKNVEFFGKMGLYLSPILIKKAKADAQFRRFLWDNHKAVSLCGVQATLYAYKHNIPSIEEAQRICLCRNQLNRLAASRIPEICGTKLDRKKVLDYVDCNNINYASYDDYLKCCKDLRLNLNDTKVVYPNDFDRMHELRSSEYAANQAKIDRRKRAKLYKAFREKAQKAKKYEFTGDEYILIVPSEVSDLMHEGDALSHCVGKVGYDKKMADGISLIMFCRKKKEPSVPFVTVEYRLDKKALNQCYGYHDSKPSEEVLSFVNEWAHYLTNLLKKETI